MYWPLIPSYEKSMKLSYNTMNAKVERLRERRTWRRLLESRRCIIPVDGFYEFVGDKPAGGELNGTQAYNRPIGAIRLVSFTLVF